MAKVAFLTNFPAAGLVSPAVEVKVNVSDRVHYAEFSAENRVSCRSVQGIHEVGIALIQTDVVGLEERRCGVQRCEITRSRYVGCSITFESWASELFSHSKALSSAMSGKRALELLTRDLVNPHSARDFLEVLGEEVAALRAQRMTHIVNRQGFQRVG